jgi:hypothetical protein
VVATWRGARRARWLAAALLGAPLVVLVLIGLAAGLLGAALAQEPGSPKAAPGSGAAAPAGTVLRPVYAGARSQRAETYYARRYGVDQMQVRSVSSGSSLEFRYRVVDPQKAAALTDKRAKPVLIDQKTGNRLTVPTMEKIGELRQTAAPEEGHEYWMVFANPGKLVRPGQRVDVVIGAFRASSLTVE